MAATGEENLRGKPKKGQRLSQRADGVRTEARGKWKEKGRASSDWVAKGKRGV